MQCLRNFSKNPSKVEHLQRTRGRECGPKTIEGAAETIRIGSIGTNKHKRTNYSNSSYKRLL